MPTSDMKIDRLARYLFTAPSWPQSLIILVVLGLLIDGASFRLGGQVQFLGTIAFTIPALSGFLFTKPIVETLGKQMTWNRSALLALSCTIFSVIIAVPALLFSPPLFPFLYAISLGFTFGVRLLVLVAIADYRIPRMVLPALTQSFTGAIISFFIFPQGYGFLALVLHLVFGVIFSILILVIERPLYRAFHVRGLSFLNAFIANLTDGSKALEEYFRKIGQEVYIPQVTLFFSRASGVPVTVTIPNVHPGPMGEIGGGNLPKCFQESFEGVVMVPHGCATHDFNLVSESEIEKLVDAVRLTRSSLRFQPGASRAERINVGSVHMLVQRIGDSLLLVGTRSPLSTEDLEYAIGSTIMAEGHRVCPNIAFIDAHNNMSPDLGYVQTATLTATEYQRAAQEAFSRYDRMDLYPVEAGISHHPLPYGREQGFGDQGLQVLVIRAGGQTTAYVLFDGNNMAAGVREKLRDHILTFVNEAEFMTTDSHVVNTVTGKNPVGLHVPPEELMIHVEEAVNAALADLSLAEVAGSTACCERVVVFGSNRIAQLASTVNAMLIFIPPLSAAFLIFAFLLSIAAYVVLV